MVQGKHNGHSRHNRQMRSDKTMRRVLQEHRLAKEASVLPSLGRGIAIESEEGPRSHSCLPAILRASR